MVRVATPVSLLVITPYLLAVADTNFGPWQILTWTEIATAVGEVLAIAYGGLSLTSTPAMLLLLHVLSSYPEASTSSVGRCARLLLRAWVPGAIIGLPFFLERLMTPINLVILINFGLAGFGSAPALFLLALAPRVVDDPAAKRRIAWCAWSLGLFVMAAIGLGMCGFVAIQLFWSRS
jgi:hypothetical protein